jgi:hypothetical protein
MALGFAVTHAHEAHASGGRIHGPLIRELNDLPGRPPQWWFDRPKFGDLAAGLIPGRRAPDEAHGGVRHPYKAEVEDVPGLLAEGWTPDDPTILDELDLLGSTLVTARPGREPIPR